MDCRSLDVGSMTVDGKDLMKVVKEIPNTAILSLESQDNWRVKLSYGMSEIMFDGLDPADFPEALGPPLKDTPIMLRKDFVNILKRISFAASNDESRYNLNNLYWDTDNLVATDGHRLAMKPMENPFGKPFGFSKRFAQIVEKICAKEVLVAHAPDKFWTLETDGYANGGAFLTVQGRCMESDYPQYKAVLPGRPDVVINMDHKSIKSAIKQILPDKKTPGITFVFSGSALELSTKNAKQSIVVQTHVIDKFETIINGYYMLDMLDQFKDSITMSVRNGGGPIKFEDDMSDYMTIIMPMRK